MTYLDLFKSPNTHNIDYLLIGGFAMNLHGVQRMTMDVSLVIAMDANNVAKLANCARKLGLHPNVPVKLEDIADAVKRYALFNEKNLNCAVIN